jgi:hypothetical protein
VPPRSLHLKVVVIQEADPNRGGSGGHDEVAYWHVRGPPIDRVGGSLQSLQIGNPPGIYRDATGWSRDGVRIVCCEAGSANGLGHAGAGMDATDLRGGRRAGGSVG